MQNATAVNKNNYNFKKFGKANLSFKHEVAMRRQLVRNINNPFLNKFIGFLKFGCKLLVTIGKLTKLA